MKRQKESKAFWIFLLSMLMLPFFLNYDLAAQDEDLEDVVVAEEEPLFDEENKNNQKVANSLEGPNNSETNSPVDADELVDEDHGSGNEQLPALSTDPNKLLGKVNGLYRAKKYDEVIKSLQDHEDVVETSVELAVIYVNALINVEKPDWNSVNRAGKILARLDRKNALADYAQGLYYQNKSKPDLAKAIMYFGKAKSAKKPHPNAARAYYIALVKKFWITGLALIALPIIIIVNKIKKMKAAKAAVQLDLEGEDQPAQAGNEHLQNEPQATIADNDSNAEKADDKLLSSEKNPIKPEVSEKSIEKANEGEGVQDAKVPQASETVVTTSKKEISEPVIVESTTQSISQPASQPSSTPIPQPPSQPSPQALPSASSQAVSQIGSHSASSSLSISGTSPSESMQGYYFAPSQVTPQGTPLQGVPPDAASETDSIPSQMPSQPAYSYNQSLSSKQAVEIEQARSMLTPQRREPVSADPELDAVWSRLCRKALQNKIPAQAKNSYDKEPSHFFPSESPSLPLEQPIDLSSIDPNVSIDLSEEALKEDLIGKLKMLAITDSELRSLLAQKNPKHIPHLIEYVLSNPEPVRLALVTRELGNYQDPAVIDTLASLLYHEDPRVALAAIQALEISRNTTAVLHICPFLKSDVPLLAQAARTALANFGAVQILKAFAGLPQYPDLRIRKAGVFVLSRMKGAQVEQLLMQMLNDDSQEVREKVILAMAYQKNPVYIDKLREFFRIAVGPDKTLARKAIVYLQGFVDRKK